MIETKLRRIGSSLGVLLPKRELDAQGLKEGDAILVPSLARKGGPDLFGVWKSRPVRLEFEVGP